jgi:hypothetical protein
LLHLVGLTVDDNTTANRLKERNFPEYRDLNYEVRFAS